MAATENMLRYETSPYLLQHAENPVHWRPWGTEALREARDKNRPILLSIGYAACHWCHVMAHESFEDRETADLMNRLFINVKLDREERPDIDHIYMSALQALGEQGGWPLTMFLAPDGTPFWGGTYFPPEPRWGRPSFRQVLQGIAALWDSDPDAIRQNTAALSSALARMARPAPGQGLSYESIDRIGAALLGATDPEEGGLRGAPKFPNPPLFRFFWQLGFRTGQAAFFDAVALLLTRMSQGGIYDHLGGGFARYATDRHWLVPHFEKMLYDNAQIIELLSFASAAGGRNSRTAGLHWSTDPDTADLFAARTAQTVAWLAREMLATPAEGPSAFAASQDADSEGEEGRFYLWTEAEIDALLGADSAVFKTAYDVRPEGNWNGRTILHRITPPGSSEVEAVLARCRAALLAARARRVPPGRDDKVLADWNALAIVALARAAAVFGRAEWLRLAESAYAFIMTEMAASNGRVCHAWRSGRISAPGLLEDHAGMARAALALFEATGDPRRLAEARQLSAAAHTWVADPYGSYYTTASDAADVPLGPAARPRTGADNATPSGNGMMAEVLARLFHLTGETLWRERAEAVLAAFSGNRDALAGSPTLLAAADLIERGTLVVIAGDPALPAAVALRQTALATPDPAVCVLTASGPTKSAPPGHALAYVCRGQTCSLPIEDPDALGAILSGRTAAPT
jgi:uncharacterized protein YyaL (SSP411 family)